MPELSHNDSIGCARALHARPGLHTKAATAAFGCIPPISTDDAKRPNGPGWVQIAGNFLCSGYVNQKSRRPDKKKVIGRERFSARRETTVFSSKNKVPDDATNRAGHEPFAASPLRCAMTTHRFAAVTKSFAASTYCFVTGNISFAATSKSFATGNSCSVTGRKSFATRSGGSNASSSRLNTPSGRQKFGENCLNANTKWPKVLSLFTNRSVGVPPAASTITRLNRAGTHVAAAPLLRLA
jgi:hypothetical protein